MQLLSSFSLTSSGRRRQRRAISGSAWWVHLFGAIALVAGLFLPLTTVGQALALPGDSPVAQRLQTADDTVPAAPVQVAAIGEFQTAQGCAAFDPYCQTTQLVDNDGIWTGVFAAPPGAYTWQIAAVAQDGAVSTYGQGGLGGPEQEVQVGDSDLGLYFELNTHTNDIDAQPVDALLSVQVDGASYALRPTDGGFEVLVSALGGPASFQLFVGADPVTDPQQVDLAPGPNRLSFSADGQLVNVEGLTQGTVTIQRLDTSGAPLSGGCYQLRDGNDLVNQGCDADDGSLDANTSMTFPEGVPGGNVDVVEVTAPDGAEPIGDQELALAAGDLLVTLEPEATVESEGQDESITQDENGQVIETDDGTIISQGEDGQTIQVGEDEEDGDDQTDDSQGPPGDLVVTLLDPNGQPIGGACFELVRADGASAEVCDTTDFETPDFANNGNTGFFGVPSGSYTLRLSQELDGVTVDERQIEVIAGQQVTETITAAVTQEDDDEEDDQSTTGRSLIDGPVGDLVVLRQDQDGNPIGGACFEILDANNSPVAEGACDEDGDVADDGRIGFLDVPEGTWLLRESRTPDGFEPVPDQLITIVAGSVIEQPAQGASTDDDEPLVEEIEGLALEPTATPAEEDEDEAQGPGNLLITLVDADGQPVGGACFELVQDDQIIIESCDTAQFEQNPDNGTTGFYGVPAGTYTVRNSENPDDLPLADDVEVDVTTSPPDVTETIQLPAVETPEEIPTSSPTSTPTETPTETPTTEPTAESVGIDTGDLIDIADLQEDDEPGPPGDLIVSLQDADGDTVGGACFQIEQEGQSPITSCDSDDPFPDNGNTGFFGVPSGTYQLTQTQTPGGTNAIEPTEVVVEAGEGRTEIVTPSAVGGQDDDDDDDQGVSISQGEDGQIIQIGDGEEGDNGGDDAGDDNGGDESGRLRVDVSAFDDTIICVELNTGGGIGLTDPPAACDNGDGDTNNSRNRIDLRDVPPGVYLLTVISGAEGIEPVEVTIVEGERAEIALSQVVPTPTVAPTQAPTTGTLRITVTDPSQNLLGGACFDVGNNSGTFNFCDDDGNGIIDIPDVVFGTQTVTQTDAQIGYALADEQQIDVTLEDQNAELAVVNEPAAGTVEVVSVDADDNLLPGACVSVDGTDPQCDEDQDGVVTLEVASTGVESTISQAVAPEGFEPAATQTILVESNETTEVVFTNELATGSIRVLSANADGAALAGACVALDGGEPLCDVDGDGVLNFEDVPVGEHTLSLITPPPGTQSVADQTITVEADVQAEVVFTSAPATGSILVTAQNNAGEQVTGGVCIAYQAENAEPVTTCEATESGQFRFTDVAPGNYNVSVTQVPDDYTLPESATTVEVVAGQEAAVTITVPDISSVQGGAALNFQSEDGAAVAGVCFLLIPDDGGQPLGRFCDNGTNDLDATEGVVQLAALPAGTYGVLLVEDNDLGAFAALNNEIAASIIIEAGVTIEQVITVPGVFVQGSIQITTIGANSGDRITGACYTISTSEPITVCDNNDDGTDLTADEGIILVDGIDAGAYTVSLTTPPSGYSGAPDQTATVVGGETTQLTFEVESVDTSGTLIVSKVDDVGQALAGSCFRLQDAGGVFAEVCDSADGADDGTITFSDVPVGTWQLVETRTPGNQYQPVPARLIEIEPAETTTVEVVNSFAPGGLHVIKVDADDPSARLDNACFLLDGVTTYGPFCDGDDLTVDGRTVFNNVVPGVYTLVETQAPDGYDLAPERAVTIEPGVTLQVTIANSSSPPPPQAGTLIVNKLDADNDPLAGGCFRLYDGDTPVTGQVCDITDGTNDARIIFNEVPVGTWTLREILAPSPSYQIAPDQQVTIEDDVTTEVNVVNQLKSGRVLVHKVTQQGHPIAGACFDLEGDGQGERCSNAAGELLFENVPVGTYTLNETVVPYGFEEAEPVEGIRVNPGQTTVITVENVRQPPPNTGSVQVLKFVCPVESADDERTVFLGGAAGDAQLAQTVGCSPANAEFTLVGEDGSDGPGAFATGDDGQYQVTVPAEVYRLDETNPDLPGNSAALLRVEVGRLTTVVVINYIAPPAPDPVDINVTKYTCQAGFNGTTYQDFAASCTDESQLTNGITVRAEGEVDLRAVTGDGGERGRTAFVDQPSGEYTIYEERPYNIPTNYGFCGWDSAWPADYKTVNGAITAELGEGEDLNCVFFNIPERVTDETGVVLVRKFTCDVDEPTKGYNFEDECRLSDENAQFELKQFNEELQDFEEDGTVVTANPDGFVRHSDLRPGTYQLREVGSNWCHANSDSVDSNGDVVVRAGAVSQVWIYNCVGPEVPPNTGSGDAAHLLDPQEPESTGPEDGNRAAPGIAWPVLIAAALAALWPRKVLAPAVIRTQVHRDAA
ncbi:MAG: SpaA isopeptide-forming pilin-related protein [Thermomicrobiales bacterium]